MPSPSLKGSFWAAALSPQQPALSLPRRLTDPPLCTPGTRGNLAWSPRLPGQHFVEHQWTASGLPPGRAETRGQDSGIWLGSWET